MKKKIIKIISLIILFFLPFCVAFTTVELLPDQYDATYLAELKDKYASLKEEDDPKIIFVGGSSLPFGLRSDLIEWEIDGYKVINFGLYATLGTKLMMELSKVNVNEGDIVVLSPELSEQTYSLYFNPTALLQACDGVSSMYKYLTAEENLSVFYNYYKYGKDKIKYCATNSAPNPSGIYRHDSFNEYGDIAVERENNVMNGGVDTTMDVYADDRLLNDDFIDYVNDYCDWVRGRGAKIYFSFSPVNELSMKSSQNMRMQFQKKLSTRLKCDLLLDLEDCIMDSGYFYDTNFHLNSSGAIYYSSLLVKALNNKLNVSVTDSSSSASWTIGGVTIPSAPTTDDDDTEINIDDIVRDVSFDEYDGGENVDFVDCFTYKSIGTTYEIAGVKDEYKDMEEVILPTVYDGKRVSCIAKDALYGCVELKRIHIGTAYKTIEDAFNGCISLERIYLYETDGSNITVSSTTLLDGANKSVKIYIPEGANYLGGYTWNNYTDKFVYYTK